MRASLVVKRQSDLVRWALRSCAQAAISPIRVVRSINGLILMRRRARRDESPAMEAPAPLIEKSAITALFQVPIKGGIYGSTEKESNLTEKKVNGAHPGPQDRKACILGGLCAVHATGSETRR